MDRPSEITLHGAQLAATISSHGAELRQLSDAEGRQLQWDGDPAVWRGRAPILFPVIGALRDGRYTLDGARYDMPKHGFARDSSFAVIAHDDSAATFRLAANDATRAIYPFEFQLDVTFAIAGATLSVSAEIRNLGRGDMPASFGFHPALRWPLPYGQPRSDHRILFPKAEPAPIRRIDADGLLRPDTLPTPVNGNLLTLDDALFVDDAIIFDRLSSRSVTYGASQAARIEMTFTDFPTLGVWTKPGAGFLCIEPWYGIADPIGFDGDIREKPGIFMVEPNGSRVLTMTIAIIRH